MQFVLSTITETKMSFCRIFLSLIALEIVISTASIMVIDENVNQMKIYLVAVNMVFGNSYPNKYHRTI